MLQVEINCKVRWVNVYKHQPGDRPANSKMSTSRPDESRRRGTVRGFINYLKKYEESNATNREL